MKINIQKEELFNLYHKKGLLIREIANKIGCSTSGLEQKMKLYGIEARPKDRSVILKCDYCGIEIYKTPHEIKESKKCFCSRKCFGRFYSGERHPHFGKTPYNKGIYKKLPITKTELEKLYIEEKKSVSQIAEMFGSNFATIKRFLERCDIPFEKRAAKYWLGKHRSQETIKGMRERRIGTKTSKETKEKMKNNWNNPEFVKKMMKIRNVKPNKYEKWLEIILDGFAPNIFKYNGDGSQNINIGGRIPDFVRVDGKKQVIEVFGHAFHSPIYFAHRKSHNLKWSKTYHGTKEHYKKYGYDCFIVWDTDLKCSENLYAIMNPLLYFINKKNKNTISKTEMLKLRSGKYEMPKM